MLGHSLLANPVSFFKVDKYSNMRQTLWNSTNQKTKLWLTRMQGAAAQTEKNSAASSRLVCVSKG